MSTREDIRDGKVAEIENFGLVYTRKCGWIDLGHASPDGADGIKRALWNKMLVRNKLWEPRKRFEFLPETVKGTHFIVDYAQRMSGRMPFKRRLTRSWGKVYLVKKGLSLPKLKSAALTIFCETSLQFEIHQASFPYAIRTDSGLSVEDLVSNLISFYRAVEPGPKYIQMCDPVSEETAKAIWDTYGPVGSYKNNKFMPVLFPIKGDKGGIISPTYSTLPSFLDTIKPLKHGFELKIISDFDDWDLKTVPSRPEIKDFQNA